MNRFKQSEPMPQAPQIPQPSYSDRQFMHTWVAGAGLPLVQAFITAIMMMICTAATLYMFDAIDYLKPIIIIGALTFVAVWLLLQKRWLSLTNLEKLTGVDLNDDGVIGEPQITRIQIDEVTTQGHIRQSKYFDLPISEDKLTVLARGLLGGRPFSEREWAGAGRILSSNEFRSLRSEMIKRELLEMANPKDQRQGYILTAPGRGLMKRFAGLPSPTPDGDGAQNV